MATVNLGLNVTATGMPNLVNQSAQFNRNMQAGAAAGASTGGTAGSRSLSSSAPKAGYAAAKAENQGYNTQRAIGGSTGSASSDFARQASGLGGLVHLYATFAANIFAVSAAFTALSSAMDTTNLVKGLDQIGAASGRNLGSVAKQMVAVTNGAISLRQAMTSTAMASSGGMTNDAILRMTEVAKKASLALGRDMTDSMDRLTKGIVKIQPELLDELGIMTRVIPAQQAYAIQIGKTASSLTDFEKRQAFANAVLTEGEKKFGSINLDTNPYSKLLSSIQNLMQSGLELVNKVLGPMISMLASSPAGLTVALGAIGATLIKQAIPAFGMFREQAKAAAEDAKKLAIDRSKAASDFGTGTQKRAALASAKVEFDRITSIANVEKLAADNLASQKEALAEASAKRIQNMQFSYGKKTMDILAKASTDVNSQDLTSLKSQATRLGNKGAVAESDFLKQSIKDIEASKQAHIDYGIAAAKSTQTAIDAAKQKVVVEQEAAKITASRFSVEGQLRAKADAANSKAQSAEISSNVATIARQKGLGEAYKNLNLEITKARSGPTTNADDSVTPKMTALGAGFTRVKGLAGLATTALDIFGGTLEKVFFWVGILTTAYTILDGIFSKSSEEAAAFGTSMETLNSSTENVARTLDNIKSKSLGDFLSVESTQAKATALGELSASLDTAISKFFKLQAAQSGWDRFFDGFWDMFGKGSGDKLASGISNTIVSAFQAMAEGPAKDEAKAAIQAIVGQKVDISSFKSINDAIKDLNKTTIGQKGEQISKQLEVTARQAGNAASALTAFKTSLIDIDKQTTIMSNALVPTDNYSKLGTELAKSAKALGDSIKDPMDRLQALRKLASDTNTLSILPPTLDTEIGKNKKAYDDLSESLASLQISGAAAKAELDALDTRAVAVKGMQEAKTINIDGKEAPRQVDAMVLERSAAKLRLENIQAEQEVKKKKLNELNNVAKEAYQELAKASYANLSKSLTTALNEAAISSAKSYLGVLKEAGLNTAQKEGNLAQASIQVQIDNVKATFALIESETTLAIRMEALALSVERNNILIELGTTTSIPQAIELGKKLDLNTKAIQVVKEKGSMVGMSSKQIITTGTGKNSTEEQIQAAEQMNKYATVLIGKEGQLAKLKADSYGITINTGLAVKREIISNIQKEVDLTTDKANLEKNYLTDKIATSSIFDKDLAAQLEYNTILVNGLAYAKASIAMSTQEAAIEQRIADLKKDPNTYIEGKQAQLDMVEALAQKQQLSDKQTIMASELIRKNDQASIKTKLDIQRGDQAIALLAMSRGEVERKDSQDLVLTRTAGQEQVLKSLKDMGAISDENYIKETAYIALIKQQAEYENNANSTVRKYLEDRSKLELEIATAKAGGADTTSQVASLAAVEESYTRQINILGMRNQLNIQDITTTATQAGLIAKQAEQMSAMVNITQSLSDIFGEFGTNVGKVGEALLKLATEDTTYLKNKKSLQDTIDSGSSISASEEQLKAAKLAQAGMLKLDKERTKSELINQVSVLGSVKSLFDTKSKSYKALDTIEKAYHIAKLAMDLKEFGVKMGMFTAIPVAKAVSEGAETAAGAAGAAARAPTLIAEIYAKSLGQLGPIAGPVVAAGLIAALLGALGGSEGGGASGPSTADIQKSQLTGQRYDASGTLQDTGTGKLGDSAAALTGIQDSLDYVGKVFFDQLGSKSSAIQTHLKGIQDNTGKTVAALLTSGGTGQGLGDKVKLPGTSTSGIGDMFQSIPVTGSALTGLANAIFGTSKTYSGLDFQQLNLKGTSAGLAQGMSSASNITTQISTQHDKSWWEGGSYKDVQQYIDKLGPAVMDSIALVFKDFNATMLDVGTSLGMTTNEMTTALKTLPISIQADITNMTGPQIVEALGAQINSSMNGIINNTIGWVKKFGKVGEDSLTTAIRLVKDGETIDYGLKMVGKAVNGLSTVTSTTFDFMGWLFGGSSLVKTITTTTNSIQTKIERQQKIISNFGGTVDDFATAMQGYYDNILSDQERATLSMANVSDSMSSIGAAGVTTKEQFKALLDTLDPTTQKFADLVKLAPAFTSATDAVAKLAKDVKDLADTLMDSRIDQAITIYGLLGESESALALTRKKELAGMSVELVATQKYIYALQNEATLRGKLVTAYNDQKTAINAVVTSLKSSIKTLTDYRNSLTSGSNALLTPTQKYTSTKNTLDSLKSLISGPTTTLEQQTAQADAISKLPAASDAFLQASQAIYASSDQYFADYQAVLSYVDSTSAILTAQQTDAEKQLSVLTDSYTVLNIISDATVATVTLLQQYIDAQAASSVAKQSATILPAHAKGGLATGLSIVGENGPELIDFKTPGQVYTAEQTFGMFQGGNTNDAVVAELRALRVEVQQLRDQQRTETGHLINAAYDAQGQNAQVVSEAVTTTSAQQIWAQKVQASATI